MDLEELNKTQIILLTLLVSFVTSIATGIVTVSLMSQAPQGITQTVNRIVERTVERVVDASTSGQKPQPTTEKTVIVKDDDAAADSITKVQNSIIRLVAKGEPDSAFYARGVVIDANGVAITSSGVIDSTVSSEVILASGARVPFAVRKPAEGQSVVVLDLDMKAATSTKLSAATLADVSKVRLGQSVLLISGKVRDTIGQGVVAALPTSGDSSRAPYIEVTVNGTTPGAILINIFGEIIGMVTADAIAVDSGLYTPASSIAQALQQPAKPVKP